MCVRARAFSIHEKQINHGSACVWFMTSLWLVASMPLRCTIPRIYYPPRLNPLPCYTGRRIKDRSLLCEN